MRHGFRWESKENVIQQLEKGLFIANQYKIGGVEAK